MARVGKPSLSLTSPPPIELWPPKTTEANVMQCKVSELSNVQSAVLGMSASEEDKNREIERGSLYQLTIRAPTVTVQIKTSQITQNISL